MKTKCKCNVCGFELSGNAKWQTERDMWEHIRKEHEAEMLKFLDEREEIFKKINELKEGIPSLYSTEYRGSVMRGSWTL